ncbi:hypothetical protein R3P38DRAFT_3190725 [Favolaschia claudopus]|uniref:Uncharacterized protein n=1 Tax=Favolaschia claudopus TaxID=2862362 RepID=A0AAW0BMB5_9AGAR
MPTDLNTGERHLRLMPAGQRQDQLAPFVSYDSQHNVPRRNIIRAQMSEGLAYAGYFKRAQPTSPAAAALLIHYYHRHVHLLNLLNASP